MSSNENDRAVLHDAIARNGGVVLSLPTSTVVRHYKSRLLTETPDSFWSECAPGEEGLIGELIESGKPAGISFRSGEHKIMFTAPIIGYDPAHAVNTSLQVSAVCLRLPEKIVRVQRRAEYRVRVCDEEEVRIRLWRMSQQAQLHDRPATGSEITGKLINLSPGGAGVLLTGRAGKPPMITLQDRLRLELHIGEHAMLVEGIMRHPQPPPREESYRSGIQFVGLDDNLKARQTRVQLTRLIGELQRRELRLMRMGLSLPQ